MSNMKTRIMGMLAVALLALALSGCSPKAETPAPPANTSTNDAPSNSNIKNMKASSGEPTAVPGYDLGIGTKSK